MIGALVLWLAFAVIDGEPSIGSFPDEAVCKAAVEHGRGMGLAVSDCVKVTLPAPKSLPI